MSIPAVLALGQATILLEKLNSWVIWQTLGAVEANKVQHNLTHLTYLLTACIKGAAQNSSSESHCFSLLCFVHVNFSA